MRPVLGIGEWGVADLFLHSVHIQTQPRRRQPLTTAKGAPAHLHHVRVVDGPFAANVGVGIVLVNAVQHGGPAVVDVR